jgi:hypothetical protein
MSIYEFGWPNFRQVFKLLAGCIFLAPAAERMDFEHLASEAIWDGLNQTSSWSR